MGVYIKGLKMPESCEMCPIEGCEYINGKFTCPLIEIDEPNGILAYDIRKVIAFIDPHMIIATTYDEQIERAKAVKDWLLSIVGERRDDD